MGLFDGGKSQEEKDLEKVARALETMRVKEPDGYVHAGCFKVSLMWGIDTTSTVVDGVFEFLQRNGREIVDVKQGLASGADASNALYTVLYR